MSGDKIDAGVVLVLGGQRSGKSLLAERLAEESGLAPVYIATGQGHDDEMRARIDAHRARRGKRWRTIEAPLALPEALAETASGERALLVDCLSLWLTNLLLAGHDPAAARTALYEALPGLPGLVVVVSTEAGQGVVPMNALARRFVDEAGLLHQAVAARADRVAWVAAGLPLWLKG